MPLKLSTLNALTRRGDARSRDARDSAQLLQATAYHEAGHAVVGYYFEKTVRERGIRIGMSMDVIGSVHMRSSVFSPLSGIRNRARREDAEGRLRAERIEVLAGGCSEQRVMRWRHNGAHDDVEIALRNIQLVYGCNLPDARQILFSFYLPAARRLVRRRDVWQAIESLATPLRKRRFLSEEVANKLLKQSKVRPVPQTYFGIYR